MIRVGDYTHKRIEVVRGRHTQMAAFGAAVLVQAPRNSGYNIHGKHCFQMRVARLELHLGSRMIRWSLFWVGTLTTRYDMRSPRERQVAKVVRERGELAAWSCPRCKNPHYQSHCTCEARA